MTEDVKDLLNRLLRSIELERDEERDRHLQEMRLLTGLERELKGRALVGLRKKKIGRSIGGDYLYSLRKNRGLPLSDTQINVGDQVILSQYSPLDTENPKGTVYEMTSYSVTVALPHQLQMSNTRAIRLDLYVNDVTYQRMEQALSLAKSNQMSRLQALLSGYYKVNTQPLMQINPDLNESQLQGLAYALGNNGYYSIQGPPGTGKTHTAAHFVKKLVADNQRVLICADSNAAVDNLLRKLVELGEEPLRIGNPIRVNQDLKTHTMDYKLVKHVLFKQLVELEASIEETKLKQKELGKPSQALTRGLSHSDIFDLLEKGHTARGIPKRTLRSLKPWVKSQMKLDALYDKIKMVRSEIQSALLVSHSIIAATNSTSGSDLMLYEHFDWVVLDEAAQASIPSSLIPITKGERFVLFGDHFQLPPVVINMKAKAMGLDQSLMDYLYEKYPYQLTRLKVQYRMHENINALVSQLFYEGDLNPHESVANRRLPFGKRVIESMHVEGVERMQADSKSFYNDREMQQVETCIEDLLSKGLLEDQIAVITPYKAHATLLAKRLDYKFEVDTVDAFQGREKDVIIISFVRSNFEGNIGFLKDYRRLNVSISRAKMKLIMIGNLKTLKSNELYRQVFDLVDLIEL